MNPNIRKKPKQKTPILVKTELHKGYNEKNPTQSQGAFVPDNVNEKPKDDIDNKAYKTEKEVQENPKNDDVIKTE